MSRAKTEEPGVTYTKTFLLNYHGKKCQAVQDMGCDQETIRHSLRDPLMGSCKLIANNTFSSEVGRNVVDMQSNEQKSCTCPLAFVTETDYPASSSFDVVYGNKSASPTIIGNL